MHQFLSESGQWAKVQALTAAPQSASVGRVHRLEGKMTRTTRVIVVAMGAAILGSTAASPGRAQSMPATAGKRSTATEFSAQSRPEPARARTRIRVTPAPTYPDTSPYRPYSTTYPVPYKYDYPGRGYVRQCSSWLATEHRVAGTVLTPQMRCWWQPGS
jgi:hypothetical protein